MSFIPSPVLLPQKIGQAAASAIDHQGNKNDWLTKHSAIRPYLAMVARSAANAGIDPAFQAAVLAQENGGFDKWSENAHSPANANGIAQFIPSTWSGSWNPYRNQSPNNPKYAIPAQAVFLRKLLKDNGGNMAKATADYYGHDSTTPSYVAGVQGYYNELNTNQVFHGAGKSILSGIGDAAHDILNVPGDILSGAKDTASILGKIADVTLHPAKLGELLADAFAAWLKFVAKAIWKYVLAPPFHWCQRATVYYFENIMGSRSGENQGFLYDYAGTVTVAFWAVGYAILWRKSGAPQDKALLPEDTALGKSIGTVGSVVAKRKVSSPDKVREATPDKPEPKVSKVTVTGVKTLSAVRRRSVSVTQNGTEVGNNGNARRGKRSSGDTEAESATGASGESEVETDDSSQAPDQEGVTT